MKELPLLLNGPMVRAVLDRRKTQTRRPVKRQIIGRLYYSPGIGWYPAGHPGMGSWTSPFGTPGDLLYVRETWADPFGASIPVYRADNATAYQDIKWRPSTHMPKWAARLWLRVLRVWVERVQDVDDVAALSEGIFKYHGSCAWTYTWDAAIPNQWYGRAKWAFRAFWDSIYAAKGLGWDSNPLVWACGFEVVKE